MRRDDGNGSRGLRKALAALLRGLALASLVTLVLPLRADDRAVKSRVAPVYPEIAKRLKIGGTVVVRVTVSPDGKVSDARTLTGNRMLAQAAEDAVRKWRFAISEASTTVDVEVNFGMNQ